MLSPILKLTDSKPDRGFTTIELMLVLATLAIMAALVVPSFISSTNDASAGTTQASVVAVRDAIVQYWNDVKHSNAIRSYLKAFPGDYQQLLNVRVLFQSPDIDRDGIADVQAFDPRTRIGWRGPYLMNTHTFYKRTAQNTPTTSLVDPDEPSFTENYGNNVPPYDRYGRANDASIRDSFTAEDKLRLGRPIVIQVVPSLNSIHQPQLDVRAVSAGPDAHLDTPRDATNEMIAAAPSLTGDDVYVAFTLAP